MTTTKSIQTAPTPVPDTASSPLRPRRTRLVGFVLGLVLVAIALGVITSPGSLGLKDRQPELAIPGVRGNGGGTGYALSASPDRVELAMRKAGGPAPEYF